VVRPGHRESSVVVLLRARVHRPRRHPHRRDRPPRGPRPAGQGPLAPPCAP
jgi:hypothetical protein